MKNVSLIILIVSIIACNNKKNIDSNNSIKNSCASLTKDGRDACIKKNAIANKACVWEYDECYEFSLAVENFKNKKADFTVDINKVLGADHGETPDWKAICQVNTDAVKADLKQAVNNIKLSFVEDNKVSIVLDCTKINGAKDVTYSFTYEVKPSSDDSLLLRLNSSQVINGKFDDSRNGNLLDFFTKTDWLYSTKKPLFYGITQLGKLGYNYLTISLNNENSFVQAFTFASKGNGYEISNNIGAISFVFDEISK